MRRMRVAFMTAMMLVLGGLGFHGAAAQDLGGSIYPGPYYLGSPDAPVTMEEYADFQ